MRLCVWVTAFCHPTELLEFTSDFVLSSCCFSLTHQSLARQTGVQLPTAGIWVCALHIINYPLFMRMTSLQMHHPYRPCVSKPQMYSEGALSSLKFSGWDANDCSPGNNPLCGTNSRKMLSSYPKKPTSQLSKWTQNMLQRRQFRKFLSET